MSDIAHLHPLMQDALRTGTVPSREELARLLDKKIEDIPEPETESSKPEDRAANEFRARYHAMVDERIADWLDEHPEYGNALPPNVREAIEDYCYRQIQHQWATYRRSTDGQYDE